MINSILTFLQDNLLIANDGNFKTINYAFTMDAVDNINSDVPALFVYPLGKKSQPRLTDNRSVQRTDYIFAVQVVCPIETFETRENELYAKLVGEQFGGVTTMTEHIESDVMGIRDPVIWMLNTFKFNTLLGS